MQILHRLELVFNKNYFDPTKIFVLRLFKLVAHQSVPGLSRALSPNF